MRTVFLASLALSLALGGGPADAASTGSKIVLAHWMQTALPYTAGQTYDQMFRDDVRSAMEAGIDGFAVNGFGNPLADQLMAAVVNAADAVRAPGFKIVLSADMSLNFA